MYERSRWPKTDSQRSRCLRSKGVVCFNTKGTTSTRMFYHQHPDIEPRLLSQPMSTPINDFGNLNIGGMPETRSQTSRGTPGAARTRGSRGRGRGGRTTQAASSAHIPIHGHSGLLYSTQNLSPASAHRAAEGLLSEFFVDRLQSHETSRGTYYAFQLKKPVSVRIHNPAVGGGRVECTCEDYQKIHSACVHIYVSSPDDYKCTLLI